MEAGIPNARHPMKVFVTPEGEPIALEADGTWKSVRGTGSVLDLWKRLELQTEIVHMFAGLFDRVTVHVIDTDERIACVHYGDRIEFLAATADDSPDLAVDIYAYQAERLASQIDGGTINPVERFRIARTLMSARQTGSTSLLRNPLMSNNRLRKIISARNLIHVYLTSPEPEQEGDARFSWIHVDGEWLVVPGFYGTAQRTFRLRVDDALELQKQLFKAMSGAGPTDWVRMAQWYVGWRKKVEIPTES
jgi:hypothetical protein